MLEPDTIELETPRPDRLVKFYDLAAINHAAADAVGGAALKPVLRMP